MTRLFRFTLVAIVAAACGGPGTKLVRPQLEPPLNQYDFGELPVLNSKSIEIPIQNIGRGKLTVSAMALDHSEIFTLTNIPSGVESGETLNATVTFVPLKEEEYSATLSIDSDDPDLPHVEVKLLGKGSTRAVVEVNPTSLDFGRVGECTSSVKNFSITSKGTADLIIEEIGFVDGTSSAFSFVGSTRTPATVKHLTSAGLPGEIQLTVKYTVAAGSTEMATGAVRLKTTDPDRREVTIALTGLPNRAPVPMIAPFGNGAPGLTMTLDGSGSTDPDADTPLTYKWTLRSKPLASSTTIAAPTSAQTQMTLDPMVPGEYEVQLDVTDSTGVKSCQPARAKVVATPAQKLLVEMFWDNSKTDLDLHLTRTANSAVGLAPDDCFYANQAPDWGQPGTFDDPQFLRDALTGYGPEIFGYVNPIDTTYRAVVEFTNEHFATNPDSKVTVRIYLYGVVKGEFTKTLNKAGTLWPVADITWPSGDITVVP